MQTELRWTWIFLVSFKPWCIQDTSLTFDHRYSAFPAMYNDWQVQVTWEGDNTILALQSGRSLISSWHAATRNKPLPPGVAYLASPQTLTAKSSGALDMDDIDQGWACVAGNAVKKSAADYEAGLSKGLSKDEAMERCSQSRFIGAKLHTFGYVSRSAIQRLTYADLVIAKIFRKFKQAVVDHPKGPERDVLELCCRLYGLWQIEEQGAFFLKCRLASPQRYMLKLTNHPARWLL